MLKLEIRTIEDLEQAENITNKIQELGKNIKRGNGSKIFRDFAEGIKKIYDEIDNNYFNETFGEKIVISELVRDAFEFVECLNIAINEFDTDIEDVINEYSNRKTV